MLVVIGVVLIVAEVGAQQRQVLLADDDRTRFSQEAQDGGLPKHLAGILQRLVVVAESRHTHVLDAVAFVGGNLKVSYEIVGEVVASQFEEQLVLVDAVGLVHKHEYEVGVSLIGKLARMDRVAIAQHHAAAAPHVANVELAAAQLFAFLDAIDDHASHFRHATLGIFLDHRAHGVQATCAIAVVELAQSVDEDKLVAVSPQGESTLGEMRVGVDLGVAVGLEGLVGCRIKRVFEMHAFARVLRKEGVGEQEGPLALWIARLQFLHKSLSGSGLAHARIEKEEVVVGLIHVLIGGVLRGEAGERLL